MINSPLDLQAKVDQSPFPHLVLRGAIPARVTSAIAGWLARDARWTHENHGFYRQYRCQDARQMLGSSAAEAVSEQAIRQLAQLVEETFNTALDPTHCTVVIHRLQRGDFIGRHTDRPQDRNETHRVIVHIGGDETVGGDLILGADPDTVVRLRPENGLLVAFELSGRSFHEVVRVESGTRHTLVFSFWSAKASQPSQTRPPQTVGLNHDVIELLGRYGAFQYLHRSKHQDKDTNLPSAMSVGAHLVAVADTLVRWNEPDHLITAGLMHSVYGPLGFSQQLVSRGDRDMLRRAAGLDAERLAFLFSALERDSVTRADGSGRLSAVLDDNKPVELTPDDLRKLDRLVWANLVAQAPQIDRSAGLRDAVRRALQRRDLPDAVRRDINLLASAQEP